MHIPNKTISAPSNAQHRGGSLAHNTTSQNQSTANIIIGNQRHVANRNFGTSRPLSSRIVPATNSNPEVNVSYVTVHSLNDVSSSNANKKNSEKNPNKSVASQQVQIQPPSSHSFVRGAAGIGSGGHAWIDPNSQTINITNATVSSSGVGRNTTVSSAYNRSVNGVLKQQPPPHNGTTTTNSSSNVNNVLFDRVNYVNQHHKAAFHQGSPAIIGHNSANPSGGSLRGISLVERRNSQQPVLTTGGLTTVLNSDNNLITKQESNLEGADGRDAVEGDEAISSGYRNAAQINPGDRVIITDSTEIPGVPFVYRTPEERTYNVQRLNLDKRKLEHVPILQGEEELRLLNFQYNYITKLERLESFRKLVFVDLYSNRIEEIEGLEELRGLRVLMLGKNRIRNISNLHTLHKLDVLDLHGNFISEIENLNHLSELRVLNLAGNQISIVENLQGLESLAELNLRRNVITHVYEIDRLPLLQRLFLSFNKINNLSDVASLGGSQSLLEVTLDANPVSDNPPTTSSSSTVSASFLTYRQKLVCQIPNLRQLDMKRITDDERRSALMAMKKEEEKQKEAARSQAMKEKKRAAIANAAKQWDELMRQHQETSTSSVLFHTSSSTNRSSATGGGGTLSNRGGSCDSARNSNRLPALDVRSNTPTSANAGGGFSSRAESARSRSSNMDQTRISEHSHSESVANSRTERNSVAAGTMTPSAGGECDISNCHLADLDGEVLNLYGTGAIPALDKQWGPQATSNVSTILFKFIDFDQISPHFPKIRARFPNMCNLIFDQTNLRHMWQLNALSQLKKLDQLVIKENGNPMVKNMSLWRNYALYRLSHFNIRKINDIPVTPEELVESEKLFGDLTTLLNTAANNYSSCNVSSARPTSADANRNKKNSMTSSESDFKRLGNNSNAVSISTHGGFTNPLQFVSEERKIIVDNDLNSANSVVSKLMANTVKEAVNIEHKQKLLDNNWDRMFNQLVANYTSQMLDYRSFVSKSLKEIDVTDV